ncbi:EfeM/EfeO family lipoprotein [Kribbella sp. NBC_00382]|uniref:EfeM/EfeO family lipoprotein n=1 Tax=Kribbella sp. NBC_00382 TaxID=2975967 RepID=UPI002E218582
MPLVVRLRPAGALAVCGFLLVLSGCSGHDEQGDALTVTVSRGNCGTGWKTPHSGPQTVQVSNVGTVTTEVDLIDPRTGGVYAEVEGLAPNTSRPMQLNLGRATYAFRCLAEDTDGVTGPEIRVTDGPPPLAPAVLPVTRQDLSGAVAEYRAYVTGGLTTLAGEVATLVRTLRGGELAASRSAWLTTHLAYERLGAAYDTFGDFADQIDGMPDGLVAGVKDPGFVGLRRVEYGLWHGQTPASLVPVANQLGTAVAGLREDFPKEQTDPNDLPLRAHEIMENALQFELTGQADQGSGTGLATLGANLDGTQAVLHALAPLMSKRYSGWPQVATWVATTRNLVAKGHRPDGSWVAPTALDTQTRTRLNAAVSQLVEVLAPIAAIGDVRRTS